MNNDLPKSDDSFFGKSVPTGDQNEIQEAIANEKDMQQKNVVHPQCK